MYRGNNKNSLDLRNEYMTNSTEWLNMRFYWLHLDMSFTRYNFHIHVANCWNGECLNIDNITFTFGHSRACWHVQLIPQNAWFKRNVRAFSRSTELATIASVRSSVWPFTTFFNDYIPPRNYAMDEKTLKETILADKDIINLYAFCHRKSVLI